MSANVPPNTALIKLEDSTADAGWPIIRVRDARNHHILGGLQKTSMGTVFTPAHSAYDANFLRDIVLVMDAMDGKLNT